jgi:hypothetical protein
VGAKVKGGRLISPGPGKGAIESGAAPAAQEEQPPAAPQPLGAPILQEEQPPQGEPHDEHPPHGEAQEEHPPQGELHDEHPPQPAHAPTLTAGA